MTAWAQSLIRISNYEVETLQKRLAEAAARKAEAEAGTKGTDGRHALLTKRNRLVRPGMRPGPRRRQRQDQAAEWIAEPAPHAPHAPCDQHAQQRGAQRNLRAPFAALGNGFGTHICSGFAVQLKWQGWEPSLLATGKNSPPSVQIQ